jgi:hypothetical protein
MITFGMAPKPNWLHSTSLSIKSAPSFGPPHRPREFLAFLKQIDSNVRTDLEVHLMINNYASKSIPRLELGWQARTLAPPCPLCHLAQSGRV